MTDDTLLQKALGHVARAQAAGDEIDLRPDEVEALVADREALLERSNTAKREYGEHEQALQRENEELLDKVGVLEGALPDEMELRVLENLNQAVTDRAEYWPGFHVVKDYIDRVRVVLAGGEAVLVKGPTTYTTACTCDSQLAGYHRMDCGVYAGGEAGKEKP